MSIRVVPKAMIKGQDTILTMSLSLNLTYITHTHVFTTNVSIYEVLMPFLSSSHSMDKNYKFNSLNKQSSYLFRVPTPPGKSWNFFH